MQIEAKDWPEAKAKTEAWIGFDLTEEKNTWITDKETEAAKWLIMGWDVGHLPNGVVDPSACRWLSLEPEEES